MQNRFFRKIISMVIIMALSVTCLSAIASCGDLAVSSLTVNMDTIVTDYEVGEIVDLSNIEVTVTYNDNTTSLIKFSDVVVEFEGKALESKTNEITKTQGKKTLKITYKTKSINFVINVTDSSIAEGMEIISFGLSDNILSSNRAKKNTTAVYGDKNYEAQFMTGENPYVVGDDNKFKFVPELTLTDGFAYSTPEKYETDTDMKVKGEANYLDLDKRVDKDSSTASYYDGETLLATAYYKENTYQFTADAVGKTISITVVPSSSYTWLDEETPVSFEFDVVDGYNIYSSDELAIIDNCADYPEVGYRDLWSEYKANHKLTGIDTNAVILHNDLKLTEKDLNSNIYYTLNSTVNYYDSGDVSTRKVVETRENPSYLRDKVDDYGHTAIYRRILGANKNFAIYGNYYTMDLSQLPLVASFETPGVSPDYGSDFSNATLFFFSSDDEEYNAEVTSNIVVKDINLIGNANRSETVDENGKPVYAGGIIFEKTQNVNILYDNMVVKTFFIPFMPQDGGEHVYSNIKCYDAYQNAMFAFGCEDLKVTNCNFERAGGPLFILQHVEPQTNMTSRFCHLEIEGGHFQNYVTGQELWFQSVGATGQIATIMGSGAAFAAYGKNLSATIDKRNVINCIALVMSNGSDAASTFGNLDTQGYIRYVNDDNEEYVVDRMAASVIWQIAKAALSQGSTAFNVNSTEIGYIADAQGTMAFKDNMGQDSYGMTIGMGDARDYLTLNIGGFGLLLGFFDVAA